MTTGFPRSCSSSSRRFETEEGNMSSGSDEDTPPMTWNNMRYGEGEGNPNTFGLTRQDSGSGRYLRNKMRQEMAAKMTESMKSTEGNGDGMEDIGSTFSNMGVREEKVASKPSSILMKPGPSKSASLGLGENAIGSNEDNGKIMYSLLKTHRDGFDVSFEERRAEAFNNHRAKAQFGYLQEYLGSHPDQNKNEDSTDSRGVWVALTDLETLANEMRGYKELLSLEKTAGNNALTSNSAAAELESLRNELISLKEQVCANAREYNESAIQALEVSQLAATVLEKMRTELTAYKQQISNEVASYSSRVGELRNSLEVCCTQWAIAMQKAGNLEEEVESLKRKLAEAENAENRGIVQTTGSSTGDYRLLPLGPPPPRAPRRTYVVSRDERGIDDENSGIDFIRRQQQQINNSFTFNTSVRRPLTTLAASEDVDVVEDEGDDQDENGGDGTESDGEEVDVAIPPGVEPTAAVFGGNQDFNVTNLTDALHFQPKPIHSSSPDRRGRDSENDSGRRGEEENCVVLPIAQLHQRYMYPYVKRNTFNQTMEQVAHDLSTIQETSKERSSTTSSSSSNMTAFGSSRGTSVLQIRSASKPGATTSSTSLGQGQFGQNNQ